MTPESTRDSNTGRGLGAPPILPTWRVQGGQGGRRVWREQARGRPHGGLHGGLRRTRGREGILGHHSPTGWPVVRSNLVRWAGQVTQPLATSAWNTGVCRGEERKKRRGVLCARWVAQSLVGPPGAAARAASAAAGRRRARSAPHLADQGQAQVAACRAAGTRVQL